MKTKTLILLVIVLGILVGAGILIIRQKAPEPNEGKMGAQLLEKLPANRIASIIIKSSDDSVSLVKKEGQWVVKTRFDYPADFGKITDLVRRVKDIKIGRKFRSSEDTLRRLSLKDPDDPDAPKDQKGVRVYFKDKKYITLTNILLGKTRMRGEERTFPDGQYLMLGQESEIYLIDKHFLSLDKESSAWLEKHLVKVGENEIKRIVCKSADGKQRRWLFERPDKGKDLESVDIPSNRIIEKSALRRLTGALSSLRLEDVVKPLDDSEAGDMEISSLLEYHLFDGTLFRVLPGKTCLNTDACYMKLEVAYHRPSGVAEKGNSDEVSKKEALKGEGSKRQDTSEEKSPEEYALEAQKMNERLNPWIYVIPKWQHEAFITDLDQLLVKPDKKKTKKD
jgi:hypothetical protein